MAPATRQTNPSRRLPAGWTLGTIHRAIADYGPDAPRLMKRCQVMATKIFAPAFRQTVAPESVLA